MPGVCSFCNVSITRNSPGVSCERCSKSVHLKCGKLPTAIAELSSDSGVNWVCLQCRNNPMEDSKLDSLLSTVNTIKDELSQFKNQYNEIIKSLNFYGNKIDDFGNRIDEFQKNVHSIPVLQDDVDMLKKQCHDLRDSIEVINQQSRICNVEICGIPEKNNENLIDIVEKISSVIEVPFTNQNIIECHRVKKYPIDGKEKEAPKNIIVRFANPDLKRKYIAAARIHKRKLFENNGLGKNKIFVNEHLSPFFKSLFKNAREFKARNNFKYCWIKDCKIFLKKTDSSSVIHVYSEKVLQGLKNI